MEKPDKQCGLLFAKYSITKQLFSIRVKN